MRISNNSEIVQGLLKATREAAISAHKLIGCGAEKDADRLAVTAMRAAFNEINMDGKIVIGEGERDEAPMLFIGEEVGTKNGPKIDIAVDPLEGTTILATGGFGSLAVLAATNEGGFLHAPDTYMDKIAIGFDFPEQIIDLDASIKENISSVAKARKKNIDEILVTVLNRPRHEELIAKIRELGARVKLIGDGDIAAVINATSMGNTDLLMGIGGAPEGVLGAASLRTLGGQICARLIVRNKDEEARANKLGITDFSKKYYLNDLARGDVIFVATGVTDGELLKGVKHKQNFTKTYSLVLSSHDRLVQHIKTKQLSRLDSANG